LLGKAYLALNQNEKAETEFNQASSLPYAHYYLGVLYQKMGRMADAAAQFEKETETTPDNPWAYKELSELKLKHEDAVGAIAIAERGVQRNLENPELFDVLARAYLRTDDFQKAIPALRRAVALDDQNGSFHFQLSHALSGAGRGEEAKAEMARARVLITRASTGQMEVLSRDHSEPTGSHQ
jgi:tetratricopeptide (TPR) repeat protein